MKHVGIFLFDKMELLDFAGPYEVFSVASELHDYQLFKVFAVSQGGQEITTVNGLRVAADYSFNNHPPIDLLIIPGGIGTRYEIDKEPVLTWLKHQYAASQITMSVCSGTRLLAKLDLLDNLEIITHHSVISDVQRMAPRAIMKEGARFTDNGKILTAAGISAGIDLSLYLVEKLYGKPAADKTVVYMEYGDWEKRR